MNYKDIILQETKTPNGAFIDNRVILRVFEDGELNLIQEYMDPESSSCVSLGFEGVRRLREEIERLPTTNKSMVGRDS